VAGIHGQIGLKSAALGSRSRVYYLGDRFVSEDCLACLRLEESGGRDNAEHLSLRAREPMVRVLVRVWVLVCAFVPACERL
jgi:hypothetical protein